jgi:hypothetical protein
VTPGLFNDQAARILGARSFNHANKENRWRFFLASDSMLAGEFRDEYERAMVLNLELRSQIVLAADEMLPGIIFDGAIEGFWADISKLHKRIMKERNELSFRVLSQRAATLPVTDYRRMAFFANSNDSLSKSCFSGLPISSTRFTQTKWSTAVALHFVIPIPELRAQICNPSQPGMRRGSPFIVDAHGHSL